MYEFLKNLDRRWVFLLMAAAVGGSVLAQIRLPEKPSQHTLSAFRAMSKAAETVYQTLRSRRTQEAVVGMMQTRAELYEVLGYDAYERKLDELFAREKPNPAP